MFSKKFKNPTAVKQFPAFTLAEVLITLGIIGVVAAMTIPTLIQKYEDTQAASQLKKTYATLENAFRLAVNDNGTPDTWNLIGNDSPAGAENMLNVLANYMSLPKNCGRNPGCFPDVVYKTLPDGDTYTNIDSGTRFAKAQIADGSIMSTLIESANCTKVVGTSEALSNDCGWIYVDINGLKEPNRLGYDLFEFDVTKYGIIPAGTTLETSDTFLDECSRSGGGGFGCAAWVIYRENMQYKYCNGLKWDGRTTCD